LSGRGLCDELITRPEESCRLCCVVVCDLETSRMGAPYIYDISRLRVNEPTSPTSAKLWNLVSAPCLVFSCLTAHKNKQAPSTKSALLVHIKYLYNSKLAWDIPLVPSETVRVHTRMPDQGATEDNEIVYKHVNRQYKSSFILPELACSISIELL